VNDTSDPSCSTTSRLACRRVVQTLTGNYGWVLLCEDDLVALVLESAPVEASPSELERLTIHQYTIILYEACRQAQNRDRREQGYRELFRFLFRAACNRWPDLAEIVTQRALVLVYEQIDRCQNKGTFGAFALNKLRQAFKDVMRDRGKESAWAEIGIAGGVDEWATDQMQLDQEESLRVLIDAIRHLPEKRQQKVILLRFFGGVSDEAIGARLGITVSNVRVLRHRGLKQLKKDEQLRRYFEE